MKKKVFIILSIITGMSLIYCCQYPILINHWIFRIFVSKEGSVSFSISCSIIAAYIFYLIQVVLPDILEWYNSIHYRYATYCKVFQYTSLILCIFESIVKACYKGEESITEITEIERIVEANLNLVSFDKTEPSENKRIIDYILDKIEKSQEIYSEVKKDVPAQVYSAMFFIAEKSGCISKFKDNYNRIIAINFKCSLRYFFDIDSKTEKTYGLYNCLEQIGFLMEWLRNERKQLIQIRKLHKDLSAQEMSLWNIDSMTILKIQIKKRRR